jgi:hypothetical protein
LFPLITIESDIFTGVVPAGQSATGLEYTKLSIFHTLPVGTVSVLLLTSRDFPN